jgi:hypothetical protein
VPYGTNIGGDPHAGWLARGLLAYGERANVGRGSSKLPFTRLGYPVFPVSRLSSAMGHGNDFKPVGSFSIYQVERKAVEKITTRAVNIPRPHFGVSNYTRHRQIKLDKIGRCAAEGLLSRYHR